MRFLFLHHRKECKGVDQHKHEYNDQLNDSGAQGITTSSVTLAMIVCLSLLLAPCKCILCLSESYLEYSSGLQSLLCRC